MRVRVSGHYLMNEFVFSLILAAVGAFAVYWYIKFKYVLPLEDRARKLEKNLNRFTSFSKEVLDHIYIPESVEHYGDITGYYLVKIHKVFPDSSILVFEASGDQWKLNYYLKNFKTEPKLLIGEKWEIFDKCAADGSVARLNAGSGDNDPCAAELFRVFGISSAMVVPFMQGGGKAGRMLVFGGTGPGELDAAAQYLDFIASQLNAIYKTSEKLFSGKKENDQLKSELNAVLRELDMAGSRLIQRARERKALYEVVTKVTGEEDVKVGAAAILNVVAKMVDADVVACMLFDESSNELVISPGSFGIPDEQRLQYSVQVSDVASDSVRTFLSRKPFISPDAQNDPEAQSGHARLWNLRSLMLVPISLHSRVIGVLRVGSRHRDFFTHDQLEFLTIIADELAIIIEMVTLYENLSKTAQELAQMNKLKDEFLSTVSHELKTPLTTIKGFVSVILAGEVGPLNEEQSQFLTIVDESVNRLMHLIANLLDLSRLNGKVEMELTEVSLTELIRDSVSNLQLKAKENNIALSVSGEVKSLPPVYADLRWIRQVVDNLLLNAIKYSGAGASVSVSGHREGEMAVVSVEDTGPGIQPEEQKLIFDKFYRGRSGTTQAQGTGLGLAISKSVVEKHGGKIWLDSVPGAGAKFRFSLPVSKQGRGLAQTEASGA